MIFFNPYNFGGTCFFSFFLSFSPLPKLSADVCFYLHFTDEEPEV